MSVAPAIRFCEGCNEKVEAPAKDACPTCGKRLGVLNAATTGYHPDLRLRETRTARPSVEDSATDEAVGQTLGGYRIEELVGKGGMGRVYRATHLKLERQCAIKILDQDLAEQYPEYLELFAREARAAAALVHPHVVEVHNIGEEGGLHFIEMEFVHGRTLQTMLEESAPLDETLVTRLLTQTALALAAAHDQDLLHRAIKPANSMMTKRRDAKLTDFGLAKFVASSAPPSNEGRLVGTPYFMAPELFEHQPASPASDVYAMGVTFYNLLTGRMLHSVPSLEEIVRQHREGNVEQILDATDGLSEGADELLRNCLCKAPEDRFTDGGELHRALRRLLGTARELSALVEEALAPIQATASGSGDRFEVMVDLRNGRRQRIIIEAASGAALAERAVRVYSVCAPARDDYYATALELNAVMPHGAIAIETIDGQPHFIAVETHPRSACDPSDLRRSMQTIAEQADRIEHTLTGHDHH